MSFTHLHLHTEYSLLDGAIRIAALPTRLKALGMYACAITDHGVMYGVVDFYRTMKREGIHPVLGCEVYVAERRHLDKDPQLDRKRYHLVLLAETNEGYKNLMKLVSVSFIDGFYHRPRVDLELLAKYSKGLIALSACMQGEASQLILAGELEQAEAKVLEYRQIFGANNYFLEIQQNGMEAQSLLNAKLIELSNHHQIPLVATNDCHYMHANEVEEHKILLCMRTGTHLESPQAMKFESDQLYLRSPEQMTELFAKTPEAVLNTGKIAERCQVELDFKTRHLPKFSVLETDTAIAYLRRQAKAGLETRLKQRKELCDRLKYEQRLEEELAVIERMGFCDYYLVVYDFIAYARSQGIAVGPGRGSGAGSLVAYCLYITNIDPILYQLLFERFLNEERVSSPDFDIDFCYERRGEVIEYVTAKYGSDCVSQVLTFGTLAAKAVVRDVARVFGWPAIQIDRLAKLIPTAPNMTIDRAFKENKDLAKAYAERAEVKKLIDVARKFEGMPRHASTHASGVIISQCPIAEVAPLSRNDDAIVVQLTNENLEMLGLLKIDFLGLRTLTVLRYAAETIWQRHGVKIEYETMQCDDQAVFQQIGSGDTAGAFQLESQGMTEFMKKLRPSTLEDIIAGISLYRPGPMEQIPVYLAGRSNPGNITYDSPLLEPILRSTHGCLIYQEQVMQAVQVLAGFSLAQGDIVRRAMAKKKPAELARYRKLFVDGGHDEAGKIVKGAVANGLSSQTANKIYDNIMAFAGYAFNKSHAAGYAVLAYQTAYIKYHYPVEFFAALLNVNLGSSSNASNYIPIIKQRGIGLLPVDVNHSVDCFVATDNGIRVGLAAIKNVSRVAVSTLVAERQNSGNYTSFGDFLRRQNRNVMKLNTLESMIKAGAIDCFGLSRGAMLGALEPYWRQIASLGNSYNVKQVSMFGIGDDSTVVEPLIPNVPADTHANLLSHEREMLGFYLSGHPLDGMEQVMKGAGLSSIAAIIATAEEAEAIGKPHDFNQKHLVGGVITHLRERKTKRNERMAEITLEDQTGSVEVIAFPKLYEQYRNLLERDRLIGIKGHFETKYDNQDSRLILGEAFLLDQKFMMASATETKLSPVKTQSKSYELVSAPKRVVIRWRDELTREAFEPLGIELSRLHGNTEVVLLLNDGSERKLRPSYWITVTPATLSILRRMVGESNVVVEE